MSTLRIVHAKQHGAVFVKPVVMPLFVYKYMHGFFLCDIA